MQLCSSLDGVTQLVAREPLPETDYHVPLMSLPHRMAETVGHVPIVTISTPRMRGRRKFPPTIADR